MDMKDLQGAMMPSLEQAAEITRLRKEVERLQKLVDNPFKITDGDFGIIYAITNSDAHDRFYRRLVNEIIDKAEEQGYEYTRLYDEIDFAQMLTYRYSHGPNGTHHNTEYSDVLDQVNTFLAVNGSFFLDDYTEDLIYGRLQEFSSDWADEFVREKPDVIEFLFQAVLKNNPELFDKTTSE